MRGYGRTHGRRGDVETVPSIIFHHLIDAIIVGYEERRVLSRIVEISGVVDRGSSYFTTRKQRGTAVTFLDDSQSGGGSDRHVVCLYDPRFVLLHANCGIVTDPGYHSVGIWQRLVRVHRETTGRRETGVESDEDRFDGHPSLITNQTRIENRAGVEAMGHTIIPPFHCSARVRCEECGRGLQELTEVGYR